MRFQVPQFTDVEDKIFGPFTFKQFVYMAGGVGAVIALFSFLPNFIAFFLAIPVVALSLGLTFFKVNNRSFIVLLESLFKYFVGERLYIWKREEKKIVKNDTTNSAREIFVPKLSDSKLKDLSWSLDVKQAENPEKTTLDEKIVIKNERPQEIK